MLAAFGTGAQHRLDMAVPILDSIVGTLTCMVMARFVADSSMKLHVCVLLRWSKLPWALAFLGDQMSPSKMLY